MRLVYATGFNGFDTLVNLYPPDIIPSRLSRSMIRPFFEAVLTGG